MGHYRLIDNENKSQYEFHIEGHIARIEYYRLGDEIHLTHAKVPSELTGRGIGQVLIERVLFDIENKGLILVPACSFVADFINRNPEWRRLM